MASAGVKQHAVRRLVLTAIATAVCLSLWTNNKNLKSNQEELESSLKRRRLLLDDDVREEGHSPLPTYSPVIEEPAKDKAISMRPKLPKIHLVTPAPEGGKSEDTQEPTETPDPSLKSPEENPHKSPEAKNAEDGSGGKVSKLPKNGNTGSDGKVSKLPKNGDTSSDDKVSKVPKNEDKSSEVENGAISEDSESKIPAAGKDDSSAKVSGESKDEEETPKHQNKPPVSGEEDVGNHQAVPGTTARPRKDPTNPNLLHKLGAKGQLPPRPATTSTESSNISEPTVVPVEEDCTPPAYHEFPPDLFSHYQRSHGAVIVHIAVIIYMFYAVAVVCDDYFIASLEECCSRLNLSEDVAGATFMAAGSSAPELFTAILGVLVAKGDVGTGTIVGSAVFNVLFVIGICGIFSGRIVELTWWPLFRDSVFYSCTVILLISIIYDSEVTWYESVIMMVIYAGYIVLMKFNNDVHFWISRRLGIEDETGQNVGILAQGDKKTYSSYVPFNNEIDECASMPVTAHFSIKTPPPDETIRQSPRLLSIHEAALVFMMRKQFRPLIRFRSAAMRIIIEQRRLRKETSKMQGQVSIESQDSGQKWKPKSISSSMGLTAESNWKSLPTREEGACRLIKWIIQAPLLATLHYTIPDCRKERWKRFFLLTFFCSITWTAAFSYVMVWMVTLVGYTLGIPDSIMGITFLAAGTSVPDAFASLIVARQGQGDMAVSNSLGSNIFDILIGLAFPWFIQTAIIEPGSTALINSRGMVYSVVLLFLTIIITISGIFMSKWQLTPRLGIVLLCVYAVFLVISILLEFNFLGYVNRPMCQD